MSTPRTLPNARDGGSAVATTGAAYAIPKTLAPRVVRVHVSADAYVGMGSASTAPAASTSNSVFQATGSTDYILDGEATLDPAYCYVYAVTSTIDVHVSFLR